MGIPGFSTIFHHHSPVFFHVFLVFCDLSMATEHRQQVAEPFVDSNLFRHDQAKNKMK
jgi:hypothetical protein